MSGIRRRLGILLPLLALVLPAGVSAQADEQAIVAELQSIQQELMPIQERALEDTALRTQREQATQALRSAMVAIDPAIETKLDRLEAMFDEMRAAQQSGDTEKISALNGEAQQLQPQIEQAQARAMAQPEVQQRIALFQENLQQKMIELEPKAEELFRRAAELERKLRGGA